MKKTLGALVMVAGLVVVTGCARSDRWTLDGSKPGPLDDRKEYKPDIQMANSTGTSGAATVRNDIQVMLELVTENDYAVLRNKSDAPALATVQVRAGEKGTAREIQVLVPAKSDVRLGRTSGTGDDASSYRIVRVERK